ncbi:glycosyl hydrolase family 18 protein [Paenibacillus sp. MMS18-CY102]|uniref:glycosyl hydrolase family 18 protein n=1 Tax=Paenibacillus sp. MMS18-CY102 TaxID=2682849 RepID=UPI001365DF66|nr:glycosyl hydrolase family 18 protein [Paenibacillus sp. MMS18-CY102]MWC27680.1 glycoside hydrolase [Paenibacillus sp. MMS18-CY102]
MFKKVGLLVVVLGMLCANSAFAYNVQLKPFKDEQNDYARESIYTLSALGIINGYEDGTYRANVGLSREAFIKLLVMARQLDTTAAIGKIPADVAKSRWSAPFISVANAHQWIDSLLDKKGMFHPDQTITRQEVAMLVGKALLESETEQTRQLWLGGDWKIERDTRAFKDQSAINAAMQPYVYYAANRGMMEGDPAGFKPSEPLIRKQAAAVITRLIDDRVSGQRVDFTGYYAIQSYPAIQQMDKLANVIFGWSHLAYSTAGTAALDVSTTVNKMPDGYEEALAAADYAQASKELMVFYDGSNLKDFLKDEPAQQSFIQSLLAVVNNPAYSFTGVSMDFEGLKEAGSAAEYVRFLQKVKDELGTGLTMSVAVPPIQYYKGYDLAAIGKLADTVILMAYDFTHNDSKLPSAPLPLVNDTVVTALKAIPKEKLVLGISKQANQWITSAGVTGKVLSPAIADVEKRLAMPGVTRTWELPYFLAKATFKDERGSHEIYYEDTQSIAKKVWLAKFYNLKGVSLWFMGNYTASDWDLVGAQTNNR